MIVVSALLFGLAFGSFANAAIDRLPRGVALTGRSRCDACARTLGLTELVPVFSYVALRGRCSACRAPIGIRSPLVEACTGLAFALLFALLPPAFAGFACTVFVVLTISAGIAATRKERSA
jgi:leader peptidase (prepilin peptidase)/N-methyltransferase